MNGDNLCHNVYNSFVNTTFVARVIFDPFLAGVGGENTDDESRKWRAHWIGERINSSGAFYSNIILIR